MLLDELLELTPGRHDRLEVGTLLSQLAQSVRDREDLGAGELPVHFGEAVLRLAQPLDETGVELDGLHGSARPGGVPDTPRATTRRPCRTSS